jgi:hypothetical protein
MNHDRLSNEHIHDYAIRLYQNKLEYDLTSEDICEILNKESGLDKGESAWRKFYSAFKKGFDFCLSKRKADSDLLKEIEDKKREIIAEKDRLSIIKREYNAEIKKKSRQELFYENISKAIHQIDVPVKFNDDCVVVHSNNKEYLLAIADIHAGSHFDIGINSYSYEICTERFKKLFQEVSEFVLKNNLRKLNIVCMGDTIQGILRRSDLKLNESSVVEATVFVSKVISNFLNELSSYVQINYFHCPTGNHSQTRPLGSERNELKDEDVEFIIGNYIKDTLRNNNDISVYTNFGKDYIEFDIAENSCIATHGHTIRNKDTAIADISFHNRKFYDVLFLAHFHGGQFLVNGSNEFKDIETYIVPSFIGTCPYSDSLMKSSKPSCMIYTFEKNKGITGTNKILI